MENAEPALSFEAYEVLTERLAHLTTHAESIRPRPWQYVIAAAVGWLVCGLISVALTSVPGSSAETTQTAITGGFALLGVVLGPLIIARRRARRALAEQIDQTRDALIELNRPVPEATPDNAGKAAERAKCRVFIAHGHAHEHLTTVKEFLRALDLDPIVMTEKARSGATVIEQLTALGDVDYAVILMTPDDMGGLASAPPETYRPRPRQNVLLELGYFVGRLGRQSVGVLTAPDLELPSNLHGVLHTKLDEGGRWRFDLTKELRAAGLPVDANSLV